MDLLNIVVVALVATGLADLWQQVLRRVFGLPIANWAMIGRWVGLMARGVFWHRQIAGAPAVAGELAIGWIFHYVIGFVYAALYLLLIGLAHGKPTIPNGLAFGLVTLVAPFLLMQPALGLGVFARFSSHRSAALFVSCSTHAVFGFGLFAGTLLAAAISGEVKM